MKKTARGFTLIEILISIALMVILMGALTTIFMATTDTVAGAQARTDVYNNARYALDILESDLLGCLSFDHGFQRFIMENGRSNGAGEMPVYGVRENYILNMADRLTFRTTTAVGATMQTAEVTYELIPGNKAIGKDGFTLRDGDPHAKETAHSQPPRALFTLIRRTRVVNRENSDVYDAMPHVNQENLQGQGDVIPDGELCRFVTSFNLEYLSSTMTFSQLDPSPFTRVDPLGDGRGPNDGENNGTPLRVPAIRVTMTIIDDIGERSERTISKTIWIPMG